MTTTRRALTAGLLLGTLLAGCGEDETGGVAVEDAWARTSPANAEFGAIYMTLTAATDDALVGALVDTAVAGATEIHETMADGDEMEMGPVESIDLPADTAVSLEPGGYHVMLIDLIAPLEAGDTVAVDLTFESGATETVDVPVQDEAP